MSRSPRPVIRMFGRCGAALLVPLLALTAAAPARADSRSSALVRDFRTFCARALPDFDSVQATAQSMHLIPHEEQGGPITGDQGTHTKSWSVATEGVAYDLTVGEARNGSRHVVSCTLHTAESSGLAARQDLGKALPVGQPAHDELSADSSRKVVLWKMPLAGELVTVMLAHPTSGPGFDLGLLRELPQ